jgi:hypothetical protein
MLVKTTKAQNVRLAARAHHSRHHTLSRTFLDFGESTIIPLLSSSAAAAALARSRRAYGSHVRNRGFPLALYVWSVRFVGNNDKKF